MKKNFRVFFCAMLCMTLLLSALPVQAENEKGDLWLTDEKVTLTCWYPINQATFSHCRPVLARRRRICAPPAHPVGRERGSVSAL